jgi:hypothetical protein
MQRTILRVPFRFSPKTDIWNRGECGNVIVQIEKCLESHAGARLRAGVKWSLAGKGDMEKLRSTLEAHKSALDIALEMVTLYELKTWDVDNFASAGLTVWARTLTREIKTDTAELRNDTSAIKDDTEQILLEIARLRSRLPKDEYRQNSSFILKRYLEDLTTYAESSYAASAIDYRESPPVGFPSDQEVKILESAKEMGDRPEYPADSGKDEMIESLIDNNPTSESPSRPRIKVILDGSQEMLNGVQVNKEAIEKSIRRRASSHLNPAGKSW